MTRLEVRNDLNDNKRKGVERMDEWMKMSYEIPIYKLSGDF